MKKIKFRPLTAREIKPEGWLKKQLEIQAEGLSGHLDLIWPDIRESKWIGGDKDGWERVPYWLDGFIPLAYLLDNEELKTRAQKYVDAIIEAQRADGWICPCENEERARYDVWAAFLICKVLVVYYDCTQDERVEEVIYRAMKQLFSHISSNTIFNWAATRWYECLIPLLWLHEKRPEKWILDMIVLLDVEGVDFEKAYELFEFSRPEQQKYWSQINHVVNTAMALKSRALMSLVTGEEPNRFARKMYDKLMKHNSMVTGHFTGDECLAGDSPIQGSECCSVAEAMYSCEVLLSVGGDPFWGDLLEKEAFNSIPATMTPDMWAHQYVQMTNQIASIKIPEESVPFTSNPGDSHIFGLEPNFGCCTANFNQAWPKFALSVMMEGEKGPVVNSMVPASAQFTQDGKKIFIRVISGYPFRDEAVLEVETDQEVEFELALRIPGFAKCAWVNDIEVMPGIYYKINRIWTGKEKIIVKMEFETKLIDRPYSAKALVRGPLVFSLPIEAEVITVEYVRDGVERKVPYCDYEMRPISSWNYGYCSENFEVEFLKIGEFPFSIQEPPIRIRTEMVKIPWKEENGVCTIIAAGQVAIGEPEKKYLQPYGCTNLRMTEMPWVKCSK